MKTLVENGKICNQTTMGERLKRTGEAWIVDETDCFRLDFVEKMEKRVSSTTSNMGVVLQRRTYLRFVYS